MKTYASLKDVLGENEEIFFNIFKHAMGGPVPKFIGLTENHQRILALPAGLRVSKEWATAMKPNYQALIAARNYEAKHGSKRPYAMLEQHVMATSASIGAYVSRLAAMESDGA